MRTIYGWINKQFLLFCLLLGFASGLYAVEVPLYQVELPTQNQAGNFDQTQLLKEAFQAVLVRLTGSEQVLSDNAVTDVLKGKDMEGYVKQFSYHQRSASEKTIKVIFNENRINALLKSAKKSIWEKNRPLVLVWLAGADVDPMISAGIEKLFSQRGIPFVFPLYDLTDTTAVSDQDLLADNTEKLEQAAKRYNPDVILLGQLSQQNNSWQSQWRIVHAGEKNNWDNSDPTLNGVLNKAADALTLKLKSGNVVAIATDPVEEEKINHLILTVMGNLDAQQYSKILEHLRRLPGVSEAEVAQIMPDKTLFELVTTQSKDNLTQSIADGKVLSKTAATEGSTVDDTLVYEFSGV